MAHKTHVLLVEHESIDQDTYTKMLQYFFNKVTSVRLASTAVSILLEGKTEFDVVMTSTKSPDSCGFQLLEVALEMNLLVVLMSNNDDAISENGALLGIKKPVTMQIMRKVWQHVVSGRVDQQRENNKSNGFRKKVWVEWSEELHHKFMRAVTILGEGRCYPRAILNLMNVPELSRMQVASHLQRCRNAKWVPTSQRKSKIANMGETSRKKAPRTKTMSFGSMPHANNKINRRQLNIDIPPPTETNELRDYNLLGNGCQYPQLPHECEIFEMRQLGHDFGMYDQPIVVDPVAHFSMNQPDITADMLQTTFAAELEMDLDGTLEALVLQKLKSTHKVPSVSNGVESRLME